MSKLDIRANRSARKYSRKEQLLRVAWAFLKPFFKFSPRPFFGWRRTLLKLLGAKIGNSVNIYPSAIIYMPWNLEIGDESSIGEYAFIYNLGKIVIGKASTISQRAHLCAGTHDYNLATLPLLKPPIYIGDNVWVCADAFIGPGVKIGDGAVLGARSVVSKDVVAWKVVAGNPARVIKERNIRK